MTLQPSSPSSTDAGPSDLAPHIAPPDIAPPDIAPPDIAPSSTVPADQATDRPHAPRAHRTSAPASSSGPVDAPSPAGVPPATGAADPARPRVPPSPLVGFAFRSFLALYVLAMIGLAGLWYLTVYARPDRAGLAPGTPTDLLVPAPDASPAPSTVP